MRVLLESIECALSTTGDEFPLGGHVHIGIGFEYIPDSKLVGLLGRYLKDPFVSLNGKARGDYANDNPVEEKPYGFEYRSAPAAVYANPRIAKLFFTVAKNVCERYFNEGEFCFRGRARATIRELMEYGKLSNRDAKYYLTGFQSEYNENYRNYRTDVIGLWVEGRDKVVKSDPKQSVDTFF
jgi:hypothetical protein